jgi:hypothetical protein
MADHLSRAGLANFWDNATRMPDPERGGFPFSPGGAKINEPPHEPEYSRPAGEITEDTKHWWEQDMASTVKWISVPLMPDTYMHLRHGMTSLLTREMIQVILNDLAVSISRSREETHAPQNRQADAQRELPPNPNAPTADELRWGRRS